VWGGSSAAKPCTSFLAPACLWISQGVEPLQVKARFRNARGDRPGGRPIAPAASSRSIRGDGAFRRSATKSARWARRGSRSGGPGPALAKRRGRRGQETFLTGFAGGAWCAPRHPKDSKTTPQPPGFRRAMGQQVYRIQSPRPPEGTHPPLEPARIMVEANGPAHQRSAKLCPYWFPFPRSARGDPFWARRRSPMFIGAIRALFSSIRRAVLSLLVLTHGLSKDSYSLSPHHRGSTPSRHGE